MQDQKGFGYFVSLPQSLYITMDCHAATDPDENCCITTVAVLSYRDDYISKKDAFKWAIGIIRTATRDADTFVEGELHKVIPLRATVSGMQFKLHFVGVPDQLMSSVILPAFEKEGQVAKFSKDQEENDEARCFSKAADTAKRAQAIGDVAGVNSMLETLLSLRGDGGTELRKRKFSDNCANVLERSQRFASNGMREMREDARDTEE